MQRRTSSFTCSRRNGATSLSQDQDTILESQGHRSLPNVRYVRLSGWQCFSRALSSASCLSRLHEQCTQQRALGVAKGSVFDIASVVTGSIRTTSVVLLGQGRYLRAPSVGQEVKIWHRGRQMMMLTRQKVKKNPAVADRPTIINSATVIDNATAGSIPTTAESFFKAPPSTAPFV